MGLEWAGWLVVHSTIEVDSALSAFQVDGSTLASWDDDFFHSLPFTFESSSFFQLMISHGVGYSMGVMSGTLGKGKQVYV
jgi:hypothetical protein